jgi:hypothetical protein
MLANDKNYLANTLNHFLINFLPGKKHMIHSRIFVKKMVHAKKVTKLPDLTVVELRKRNKHTILGENTDQHYINNSSNRKI